MLVRTLYLAIQKYINLFIFRSEDRLYLLHYLPKKELMWDFNVSLSSEKRAIFENNAAVNTFQNIKEPWLKSL
jgi:hypothetical protein